MWCHLLLAAPLWGIVVFFFLPWPVALPTYIVIVVGSLVLYRYVWRAMTQPPYAGPETLIGRECVALEAIRYRGLVRCDRAVWTAVVRSPVRPGERVRVIAVHGPTLEVEPLRNGAPETSGMSGAACHSS